MIENKYYPALTDLLPVDQLPENLGFIRSGLIDIFSQLFYKELILNRSRSGDHSAASFHLVLAKKLAIEVPGSGGLALVLNPDREDSTITSFPLSFEYHWGIIGLVNDFNPTDFLEGPKAWFKLFTKITGLSLSDLLRRVIGVFIPDRNGLQTFVDEYEKIALSIPDNPNLDEFLEVVNQIEAAGFDVIEELLAHFIEIIENPEEQLLRIKDVFIIWLGDFSWDTIKELLIPYASASVNEIKLGLEFPRDILIPIDEEGKPIENPNVKALLSFDIGGIHFNTVDGIEFQQAFNFNFRPAEIMGTGLIISVSNLQLDLSEKSNIPAVTADGRSEAFKGIYIEEASITLPESWNKKEDSGRARLVGSNLLIGSEGGFTGTILLENDGSGESNEGILAFDLPGDCSLQLDSFEMTFNKNAVEGVDIGGTLIIPGLEDEDGNDKEISIEISYDSGVYSISADTSGDGIPVKFAGATLFLNDFSLSFDKKGIVGSSISGKIELKNAEDGEGEKIDINFDLAINNEGFIITAEEENGVVLNIPNAVDIKIFMLELGYQNKVAYFRLIADFDILLDAPLFGKYIPDQIGFNNFYLDHTGKTKDVDISATWSDLDDVDFEASEDGASVRIPMNATLFQAIKISAIQIGVHKAEEKGIDLEVLLSGSMAIGPINASVVDTGILVKIDYDAEDGILSPLDIDLDFVPPAGVGLSIETSIVSGGGYLYFDHEKGEYAGVGEISIKEVLTVTAIAIITTKPPAGATEPGFSLLIIIAAELPPIQLGFGFTLNGIGGLFAANRTMDLEALRAGVSNGTIDNILFPTDPVKNAPQIIDQMGTIFPLEAGAFTFGVMAKLGWGTPTLISLEVGLIVKVPAPIKIAILGVLKAVLPTEDLPILALVVSFVGTIDPENQMITFDASLEGSQLLGLKLYGEMAFRLRWGNKPMFLLSVGGFHPEYTPPDVSLPSTFRRITLEIFPDNPKLTLTGYFAITPNSLQFGAGIDLFIKLGKFSISGFAKFNTLIQFNPFYLSISIDAGLSVKWGEFELMGIDFGGSLKGPSPWVVNGYAEFRVIVKIKVNVNVKFGDRLESQLPTIQVLDLLLDELKIDENYEVLFPDETKILSTSRYENSDEEVEEEQKLLLHPAGKLSFKQLKVPLNVDLEKIGTRFVKGDNNFSLTMSDENDTVFDTDNVTESFAPGEFFDLSLDQKLSRPSFEKYDGGVTVSDGAFEFSDDLEMELEYEEKIIDIYEDTETGEIAELELTKNITTMGRDFFNLTRTVNTIHRQNLTSSANVITQNPINVITPELAIAYDGKSLDKSFKSHFEATNFRNTLVYTGEFNQQEIIPNYELFN